MPALAAFLLDVLAVVVFAVVGRRSHSEGITLAGVAEVAAPFAAGVALGWLAGRGWRRPAALATGVAAWAGALVAGMLLRSLVLDGGTPASFVVVTALTLGVLIVGWRLLARVLAGRSAARTSQ